jgi:twitching motility protein PilT
MELLEDLLEEARKLNASDLHITANQSVSLRIDGKLRKTKLLITKEQVVKMLAYILNEEQLQNLELCGELDCAFMDGKGLPYRVNVAKSDGQYLLVMRIIKLEIPSYEELLLPETVQALANLKQGLVLVCGATGSGKSTTLAALIEKINRERKLHIVTLEDPIEYRYVSKKSLIHQREVGRDTASFAIGLRSVLRQDPDVILVGELRDKETIAAALTAAETGHLVFATLHTNDSTGAVNRILDSFDEGRQLIRSQLAEVLQAIVCQELLPKVGVKGRVANFEVLIATPALRSLIREGRTHQIASYLTTGKQQGMLTKEEHRKKLQEKGLI